MKNIFKKFKYQIETKKLFNRVSLEQSNFSILDTETTGLHVEKGDQIISVASLKVSDLKIDEQNYLDELVNPNMKIPESSTKIHNITDEQVKSKPSLLEISEKILKFLKKSVLVGHNINFDINFLKENSKGSQLADRMKVIKSIDTIYLTASLFPDLKNYELSNLCEYFNIKTDDQIRHSALGDCIITARLFLHLISIAQTKGVKNIANLMTLCSQGQNLHHIVKNSKNIH
ncbi:MAG: 3'-5' exonuclease [Pelagibacteraceae bacterium]